MAITRIIGDIHGKIYDYRSYALVTGVRGRHIVQPERSIQVGDFGIGFFSPFWHDKESEWQKEHPQHRFIRGNHDGWELRHWPYVFYIWDENEKYMGAVEVDMEYLPSYRGMVVKE